MKKLFTKAEMLKLKGCYSETELNKCSFMQLEEITIESILDSEISLKDKSWFIINSIELTDLQKREFAIGCALVVLPIYEEKYPDNVAPRKAIEAAQKYLNNEISLGDLKEYRKKAAYAAYAAAADAAAAYAYADATAYAYAAYAAAADDAAAYAYAAYAYAAYAAAAYAAAAADAGYKNKLLLFFKEFVS
jgi:hypothetical protein